ncbi:MAG: protoglobin domain-containing protein [Mycobacterium sp.]|uniref:protoglobin domain-containing protein n=1 Tax=Mycobacterium sp. TaxID=1785 RepID=UPI0026252A56|nr:protoglobin domain-containing protein [Mycobacterium sp.]MDI3314073.1 protoglobin domain-containing protein [Mycobacterium sp.]
MPAHTIPGYTYGQPDVTPSPVTAQDVDLLKATLLWSEADENYLRMAGEVLADQVDDVIEAWYGFVGSHSHLLHYFTGRDGRPIEDYLQRVRARFAQWVRDVCTRPYDGDWRNYQHEIGLRHTRMKKNQTDHVDSVDHIPLRYLVAFVFPITATMRPFLAGKGHDAATVDGMHAAWFKAVVLHVCLWSQPYAADAW